MQRALTVFDGYPALHGSLAVHTDSAQDHMFEFWVREPQVRIDVLIPGTSYPWIGQTSDEPPDPYLMAIQADPRPALPQCGEPGLLGYEHVLGRRAAAVSCAIEGRSEIVLWIDDETGLIVRAYWEDDEESGWFGFTELELDPAFPADVFEVPATPGA